VVDKITNFMGDSIFILYIITAFFIAIVIWADRKHTKLENWQALYWILIAVGLPFFVGVPLYYFYRSKKCKE
jgi:cbb3-type cytochrome oxidase subunit 3